MCSECIPNKYSLDAIEMSKTLKISDSTHKALEIAKAFEGIQIGKYASIAIMEAIQNDYPEVYRKIKKHLVTEEKRSKVDLKEV